MSRFCSENIKLGSGISSKWNTFAGKNISRQMKTKFQYLFIFFSLPIISQTKLLSWNLQNFGKSKSDEEIAFIANTIKDYDIIAIQEVVAGNGGAQAVARLAEALNQKGAKWDYRISAPTSS